MQFELILVSLGTSTLWLLAVTTLLYHLAPIWDKIAERRMGDSIEESIRVGMDPDYLRMLMRCWGGLLVTVIGSGLYGVVSVPITVVTLWLLYLAPRVLLLWWTKRQRTKLRDQLVGASIGLANAARAGLSPKAGIKVVAEDTPLPLKTELDRIVHKYECGIDLSRALEEVADRLKLDSFSLLAAALKTTLVGGGDLSQALERISRSLQEHQRLERKMETVTAGAKRSSFLMSIFPLVFLAITYTMSPESTSLLFTTLLGQIVLAVILGLIYIGKRWMDRIMVVRV